MSNILHISLIQCSSYNADKQKNYTKSQQQEEKHQSNTMDKQPATAHLEHNNNKYYVQSFYHNTANSFYSMNLNFLYNLYLNVTKLEEIQDIYPSSLLKLMWIINLKKQLARSSGRYKCGFLYIENCVQINPAGTLQEPKFRIPFQRFRIFAEYAASMVKLLWQLPGHAQSVNNQ